MAMQVIDKKACSAVLTHPPKHLDEFRLFEMMAEQRTENDIRLYFKMNFSVITHQQSVGSFPLPVFCNPNAVPVDINTGNGKVRIMINGFLFNGFQIISATASDFANMCRFFFFRKSDKPCPCNQVSTEFIVNNGQFSHISLYICRGNVRLIKQFRLVRSNSEVHIESAIQEPDPTIKVSIVKPGPNAAPNTLCFCVLSSPDNISFKTNNMVGDDMFP